MVIIMEKSIIKMEIIDIIKEFEDNVDNNIKSIIKETSLDSLSILEFIMEIEKHFHIEFDIDDDISKLMNEIDLLVEYIVKRLGNDK